MERLNATESGEAREALLEESLAYLESLITPGDYYEMVDGHTRYVGTWPKETVTQ